MEAVAEISAFKFSASSDAEDATAAIRLVVAPNQPDEAVVLTIDSSELEFTALDNPLVLSARNMQLTRGGRFSMDEAELQAEAGLLETVGVAGILPLDLTRIHVAGIANQPFATEDFSATITLNGRVRF